MLNVSFSFSHVNYSMFTFAKHVEDWFGYDKLNVFYSVHV